MEFTLEKSEVYNIAEKFSDDIWDIVIKWDYFKKDTIGKQLVKAADSISANIAEGYGRYFYKESKQLVFTLVVLSGKQNPAYQNAYGEILLNPKDVSH